MNILGVFLYSKLFLDPLIQTHQLVYKIAVSQQVFTEDLLIQIPFCSHHTTFGSPLVAASCRIPVHFFIRTLMIALSTEKRLPDSLV